MCRRATVSFKSACEAFLPKLWSALHPAVSSRLQHKSALTSNWTWNVCTLLYFTSWSCRLDDLILANFIYPWSPMPLRAAAVSATLKPQRQQWSCRPPGTQVASNITNPNKWLQTSQSLKLKASNIINGFKHHKSKSFKHHRWLQTSQILKLQTSQMASNITNLKASHITNGFKHQISQISNCKILWELLHAFAVFCCSCSISFKCPRAHTEIHRHRPIPKQLCKTSWLPKQEWLCRPCNVGWDTFLSIDGIAASIEAKPLTCLVAMFQLHVPWQLVAFRKAQEVQNLLACLVLPRKVMAKSWLGTVPWHLQEFTWEWFNMIKRFHYMLLKITTYHKKFDSWRTVSLPHSLWARIDMFEVWWWCFLLHLLRAEEAHQAHTLWQSGAIHRLICQVKQRTTGLVHHLHHVWRGHLAQSLKSQSLTPRMKRAMRKNQYN